MNWAAVNFDWNQVRAFLATVEEGSLSAAARALGLTQPTLGRQVSALEEELGVTLFERSGRTLILTPTGEALAEHVRAMGEAATRLSLVASGQSQSVEGRVKVTASEGYAAYVLPEAVERLRETHPGIVLEIVSTNSLSDLRRREADIAVRNADPTDPEMIARRMPDQKGGLYATPGLIEKYGPFREVRDLANAPFIGFGSDGVYIDALQKRQVPVTAANLVAGSESHLVHWELARRGIGIGVVGNMVGEKDDLVVPVLHDKLSFEFPVWLVAPSELRTSRRVRIVFDVLAEVLGQAKSAAKVSKSA
ncbi:LysR family transcriptional regulator [Silicimonas sp. MF1-12-2]|uniref:LysR family transcriptional regulator n=1 Tax=Silicimonas sp. MF1-12-2 TaxID=3384793 RepID=UPI0039B4B9F3